MKKVTTFGGLAPKGDEGALVGFRGKHHGARNGFGYDAVPVDFMLTAAA